MPDGCSMYVWLGYTGIETMSLSINQFLIDRPLVPPYELAYTSISQLTWKFAEGTALGASSRFTPPGTAGQVLEIRSEGWK